jgi:hypothetical protein
MSRRLVNVDEMRGGYKRSKSRSVPQGKRGKSESDDRVWQSMCLIDHELVREVDKMRIAMRDWCSKEGLNGRSCRRTDTAKEKRRKLWSEVSKRRRKTSF